MVCSHSHQEEDLEVRVDQEDQGGQVAPVVEDQAVLRDTGVDLVVHQGESMSPVLFTYSFPAICRNDRAE